MAATPLFPGPKFVGPQAERFRQGLSVDRSLDYCSGCGTCTLVCPQGVKIAELNAQARAVMKAHHMPLRDRLLGRTVLMGKVMSPVAPLANAVLRLGPVRALADSVVGVARQAPLPVASVQSLGRWLAQRGRSRANGTEVSGPDDQTGCEPDAVGRESGAAKRGQVVFFHGCAGAYFEVETSIKAIEVLEYLGFEVLVPAQGCCGLAQQSNGLFKAASKSVLKLSRALRSAGPDLTIVSASGSCTGMLKHEARQIMGVDDPELADVSYRVRDIMEFLAELDAQGELPHSFQPVDATVPYHAPCQLKGQAMGLPALEVLSLIPGLTVTESGQACCGMAGTYGLKKEKYAIAQKVGAPVFEVFRQAGASLGLCDTETCRWQLRQGTAMRIEHPVALVHQAYGLGTCLATD
jgi:glycerol-3-phosphate dehydrogenase subunit C